jgi:hypothetical protein
MGRVASSVLDQAARDQALRLLSERAVLTRAVCRELMDSGGDFAGWRPSAAFRLLSEWVQRTFPESEVVQMLAARHGLDAMIVPEGCEELLGEIRDGAEVWQALALLFTADHNWEAESDRQEIAKRLEAYWEAHGQIVNPP